ncbi:MAG: sigma-54 dependent transcriptional regulator, partial [Deltaproteobacteria bacterium]
TLLDMKVPLRDQTGEIVGIITIARDITDRTRLGVSPGSPEEDYPSKAMQLTLHQARIAANKASTILLTGESGSGKDYLARYIHDHSDWVDGPYFSVNCAAIAPEVAESELFGHEKGAFTGAVVRKRGMVELAEGGTLLLNEIGDLPIALQAKLLTFFDTRKLTRVGGEREISVSARVIAATNRDLENEVERGRFRRDLFYRLNVIRIEIPPLRERLEDIPVLARKLLAQVATEMQLGGVPELDDSAMEVLVHYQWPGNVRELRNMLERHLILWDGKRFDLPAPARVNNGREAVLKIHFRDRTVREVTEEVTRAMYLDALRRCSGNKKKAAKLVGMSRDSLYRYMKKFGDRNS